jgi:hypothetical protein
MAHDVFISYSSKDKTSADAVCAVLEQKGIRCWIAPRDIVPGRDWSEGILDGLNAARVFVLVFSSNANASQQIKREVERAVHLATPVIPFRVENVAPSGSLEYFISTQHWLDAFTPPLEQHLDYLAGVIRHILEGKPQSPPRPPPKRNGWVASLGLGGGKWKLALTLSFSTLSVVLAIVALPKIWMQRDASLPDAQLRSMPASAPSAMPLPESPPARTPAEDAPTGDNRWTDGASSPPVAEQPVSPPPQDIAVVEQFYRFLGMGDGTSAAGLVVPEKREQGPLSASEMTRFYSSLSKPLVLFDVAELADGRVRVHYGYSATLQSTCDGVAFVTLSHDFATPLIQAISAPSRC